MGPLKHLRQKPGPRMAPTHSRPMHSQQQPIQQIGIVGPRSLAQAGMLRHNNMVKKRRTHTQPRLRPTLSQPPMPLRPHSIPVHIRRISNNQRRTAQRLGTLRRQLLSQGLLTMQPRTPQPKIRILALGQLMHNRRHSQVSHTHPHMQLPGPRLVRRIHRPQGIWFTGARIFGFITKVLSQLANGVSTAVPTNAT